MNAPTASPAVGGVPNRAPPATLQPPTLDTLPFDPLATILYEAGLHTRQVCRAFHAAHPPLVALAPRGLPLDASADLTAALAALPPSLTALDLRHVGCRISEAHIATITTSLPLLQRLLLSSFWHEDLTPDALYTALARLPHLHTLHAGHFPGDPDAAPCEYPPLATRLRSLYVPLEHMPATFAAPAGSLPQLTALQVEQYSEDWPWRAALTGGLAAAAPRLRSLEFGHPDYSLGTVDPLWMDDDDPLAALAALTALTLPGGAGICPLGCGPPAQLLQHIGSLTNLRSLSLTLEHYDWTPAEAGWLSRLTHLTRLAVYFYHDDEPSALPIAMAVAPWADPDGDAQPVSEQALTMASVARDAARLPLLQDLQLGNMGKYWSTLGGPLLAYGTPHSFVRHLAGATQLRRLHLQDFPLPASEARMLSSLRQLTGLVLQAPWQEDFWGAGDQQGSAAGGIDLQWAASLQALRQLALHRVTARGPGPSPGVPDFTTMEPLGLLQAAATARLHTLALRALGPGFDLAAVLVRLQGTLVWLDLGDLPLPCVPALGVLGGMQQLRGLDLFPNNVHQVKATLEQLAPHLRLPGSLRRFWLSAGNSYRDAPVLAAWRRQYPLVDFRLQYRPDPLVW